MKLSTILLVIGTMQIFATGAYSQQTQLTLEMGETSVGQILSEIESQSEFYFLFNQKLVDTERKVNIRVNDKKIDEILDQLFSGTNIDYLVMDRQIVLSPEEYLAETKANIQSQDEARQELTVTGNVTDENGEPLSGVNVVEVGTTHGAITDNDGNYQIEVSSADAILRFSYIGYITQDASVSGQTRMDIILVEAIEDLDEVVITSYGTQSKRSVTGSMQTISADVLKDIPVAQVAHSLQGKVSGVQINQNNGVPGASLTVRVRNAGSINAGTSPLYVVDGFPIDGDLTGINPEEIESITILKDASSTALYGSRGANGVILITTKGAKRGKTQVSFSGYYGVQVLPSKGRVEMMNGTEFAQFKQETYLDRGIASADIPEIYQNPEQYGEGTNWYDIMFEPAPIQNYTLTFMSGADRFRTTAVVGYFNQDGVLLNSGYDRFSLRLNTEFAANDWLNFGFNLAPAYSKDWAPVTEGLFWQGNLIQNSLLAWPIVPYKNDDGTLPLSAWIPGSNGFPTPNYYRAAQEIEHDGEDLRLLSNAYIAIEPIKGLVLKSTINLQMFDRNTKMWNPSTASAGFARVPPVTASLELGNSRMMTWLNENTATYDLGLADHRFTFLAGYTVQKYHIKTMDARGDEFPDDRINDLDAAVNIIESGGWGGGPGTDSSEEEWGLISYLGRVIYGFQGKYHLVAAIRRDGSSRFGSNNRWGWFPSLSASWVLSDEGFFPQNNILYLAKLRASWGITGNNSIGNYTQYALVNLGENAIFGNSVYSGSTVANLSNTELGWETSSQVDIGLDLGLFQHRINLIYDFYFKKTTDLLYDFDIPQSSGFNSYMGNSGEFNFWGHEFSIVTRNLVGNFKWTTELMLTFADNKVVSLAENVDALYGGVFFVRTISREGDRIGLFWGLEQDGVYDNQEEYDNSPKAAQSGVGTIKFRDVDGDGQILNSDLGDRTVIGDPTPKFLFGMTNTFNYRNLDLTVVMTGSYGNDIANLFEQGVTNLDGVFNIKKEIEDRWRSEGNPGSGKYGTTNYSTAPERDWFHSRFIEDGSHLTIKNITLGYNFGLPGIKFAKSLRVYGSVQQVYTFTRYTGNNPEVSQETSVLQLGVDNALYPVPRTFTFGINVNF